MEKFTSFVDKKVEKPINEAVDPMLVNLFKKFDIEDLMTYLKGLLTKYLDMYEVQKLLPMLDKPKSYDDYMFVYNKIEGELNSKEKNRFEEMKKLFMKDFEEKHSPEEEEKKKKEEEEAKKKEQQKKENEGK
jgi:hypothetical protein